MAGITCEVFLTQRANHAYDHLRQLDKSVWDNIDGVVSVGGDGLFNECLSAIVCRYMFIDLKLCWIIFGACISV